MTDLLRGAAAVLQSAPLAPRVCAVAMDVDNSVRSDEADPAKRA